MAETKQTFSLLRKIATRTVMEGVPDAPKEAQQLFTVYGVAEDIKTGESNYGPWTGLVGDFEAVRISDRKQFRGPVCFLPEPFMALTIQQVEKAKARREKEGLDVSVEFACVVGIKPAKTKTGYEYTCEPLIEHKATDRLQMLRNTAIGHLPKLAGPVDIKKAG